MDLIKLTFRTADNSVTTRLATTAQNIDDIEASYLATIPGAVFCLRSTAEKNISSDRAFWVYQAQMLNWTAATFSRPAKGAYNTVRKGLQE